MTGIVELMRVLQFGDSTLPVGAFAFSNGLESALQTGVVTNKHSLQEFLRTITRQSAWQDGIALLAAYKAAVARDFEGVLWADNVLTERKIAEEMRLMSSRMGKKLGELACRVVGGEMLSAWVKAINEGKVQGGYPIGLALVFAELNLPAKDAFTVHQFGLTTMMCGAASRIMKITHIELQEIIFAVNAGAEQDYLDIEKAGLDRMSSFAPVTDILAAHHVAAHVRMFMN